MSIFFGNAVNNNKNIQKETELTNDTADFNLKSLYPTSIWQINEPNNNLNQIDNFTTVNSASIFNIV